MLDNLDLFDFTDFLQGPDLFDSLDSLAAVPQINLPQNLFPFDNEPNKFVNQLFGSGIQKTGKFELQEYLPSGPHNPVGVDRQTNQKLGKSSEKQHFSYVIPEKRLQECEIFDCLDLDQQAETQKRFIETPPEPMIHPTVDEHDEKTVRPDPRDQTTIAKVIFTIFKKYLIKQCPISLRPYFRACPYSKNHRTLMDFEVPYLYAQCLDQTQPGSLQAFKQFLKDIKPLIQEHAEIVYYRNQARLQTFMNYLNRIYSAYNSGLDSYGRMRILYKTPSKMPGALAKLDLIKIKFH